MSYIFYIALLFNGSIEPLAIECEQRANLINCKSVESVRYCLPAFPIGFIEGKRSNVFCERNDDGSFSYNIILE